MVRRFPFERARDPLSGMRLLDHDEAALARHGLITLASSGLSRAAWYRAIASGLFEQLHPGVARMAGTRPTYRQRLAAAVIAATRSTVALASHRSAAALWLDAPETAGAIGPTTARRPIDVTLPDRDRIRSLHGVSIHRPTDLARLTPHRIDGIRCTNILRTLIDLGAVQPDLVASLLGHALSTRTVTIDAVETVLLEHARSGRGGVTALRSAVDDWAIDAKPADSVLEIAFARLVERFDLPPVEFHPVVEGWEVDFRFVGTRVVVECDGWMSHGLDRSQFEWDRRRDGDLMAAGWMVARFTYRAITRRPTDTARRLRRLLARDLAA